MRNDADHRSTKGPSTNQCAYDIVEAIGSLAAMMQHSISTQIEQVALVVITLNFGEGKDSYRDALLSNLRPLVHKTDKVLLLNDTVYFLLLGASQREGQIVQNRLWKVLLSHVDNAIEPQIPRPCSTTIGYSAYPLPCSEIDDFIKAASDVLIRCDWQPEKSTRKARQISDRPLPTLESANVSAAIGLPLYEQQAVGEELPALARKLGIPYLSFLPRQLPKHILRLVNPKLAYELRCYPIGRDRNRLTVAMLNPHDRSALDRLHRETGLDIFPVLTHSQALQTALEQLM